MVGTNLIDAHKLFPSFSERQAKELSIALSKIADEAEKSQFAKLATKEDFTELKQIVANLAVAQQKTEQRLDQLVIAQQKTEQRLGQLVVAQQKTEQRLETLAERVDDLALAQQKTEQRLDQLVVAQQKTEKQIQKLTKTVGKVQVEVGGIGNRFGYLLEDRAIKTLPRLLKSDFNIHVQKMTRDFIEYDENSHDEINILGYGKKYDKNIMIIGEAKYQLSKKHIDQFKKVLKRVKLVEKLPIFPLFVCATAEPKVKKYAKKEGLTLFYSYQLDL